jgi:uncharacterized protein
MSNLPILLMCALRVGENRRARFRASVVAEDEPELVLAETGWLLDRQLRPAAEAALYRSVADGEIVMEPLSGADWTRIAELTERYSDLHLGGVDAGLIAVAARLGLATIATLDRRHFGVVRPDHARVLTLIP